MNIIDVLKKEHREVEALFAAIEKTSENAVKTREKSFDALFLKLDTHTAVEEEVVYNKMATEESARFKILEGFEEHRLARNLLSELATLNVDDPLWLPKLTVLREAVEHHVKEEESDIFKLIRKQFKKEELASLAEEFESKKQEILTLKGIKQAS